MAIFYADSGSFNSLSISNGAIIQGTASYATTASYAINAAGTGNSAPPSLIFSGSITASVSTGQTTFRIISGSTTMLFISKSGNIGIGTSTPQVPLDLSADAGTAYGSSTGPRFLLYGTGGTPQYLAGLGINLGQAANSMGFFTGQNSPFSIDQANTFEDFPYPSGYTTRFVVDVGGNVGIGTTTPAGKLHVDGTTTITGPWNSNSINGLHFSFNSNTGSIYSLQNGAAWRRLDIEGDPIVMGWQSAGKIGLGIESPTSKLHVYDNGNAKVAHFEGPNGAPLQIVTSDESLTGGYAATQGSIGIGSDRLQIKYGNSNDTQWADAAYNLYVGSIDLNTAYYIPYPGTYEVTVGTATGGNAIYLPSFNAWTYGAKVTIINATDEYVSLNTQVSENKYLEGTTHNISVISPRSINEYVSTATDWRILPSMKQITYTGIDLSGGDYNIYTKGIYKITVGSGDNLIFPNPANFEGETITVINTDTISANIDNNGYRPVFVDGTAYTSLEGQSIYQFVCIDGNWRVVSVMVA